MLKDTPYSTLKQDERGYDILLLRDQSGNTFAGIARAYGISAARATQVYSRLKYRQISLYVNHLALVFGHSSTAQIRKICEVAYECYQDFSYVTAYLEQTYPDILAAYRNGEPGMPTEFLEKLPEELRTPVIHNGGGVYNHWMYFSSLGREKKPMGETALKKVAESFGSLEQMKAKMKELALGVFGSGYVWLAVKDGTLVLEQTANQDTPLSLGMIPILPLDVWEHAYYLKHQNRRADYLEQYMSAVDWGIVGERIEEVVKW